MERRPNSIKTQSRNPECRSTSNNNAEPHTRDIRATACSGIPMAETPKNKIHTMEKNTDQVNMHARHKHSAKNKSTARPNDAGK